MAHPTGGEAPGRMTEWEPEVIKPFPEYHDRPTGPVRVSVVKRHGQVQGYRRRHRARRARTAV